MTLAFCVSYSQVIDNMIITKEGITKSQPIWSLKEKKYEKLSSVSFNDFARMVLGLMIATIGIDMQSGVSRFTFGILELQGGIDFLIVIIAVFAFGEVLKSFRNINEGKKKMQTKFGRIWITKEEWKACIKPMLRSTPIGFFVGVLPGAGGTIASLMPASSTRSTPAMWRIPTYCTGVVRKGCGMSRQQRRGCCLRVVSVPKT